MPTKGTTTATHGRGQTRVALFIRMGYQPARNMIQKGARGSYKASGRPLCCFFCGYSLHVDIAHKRGVMDFPGNTLVDEINHPNNLIALCPNHHREADAGTLDLMATQGLELHFGNNGFLPSEHVQKRRSYQQGSVVLSERRRGPHVWVLRYREGGKQKSIILGDQARFPTKSHAQTAAEGFRQLKKKEFPQRSKKKLMLPDCSRADCDVS